ncbi:hypothetical protein LTR56_014865 [Elasticomyces elasticus]|nr:hypothetical protein LTR56_014865 [Elasticomyces elasticus]KAK5755198.1 hypothetical protein LTS12_014762 [Elasticomyces elasticus]
MDAASVTTPYQVNVNIAASVTYNPRPAEQSAHDDYFQERDLSSIFRRRVLYEGSADLMASMYCATIQKPLTWTAERLITSTRPAARAAYRSEAINRGRAAIVSLDQRIQMALGSLKVCSPGVSDSHGVCYFGVGWGPVAKGYRCSNCVGATVHFVHDAQIERVLTGTGYVPQVIMMSLMAPELYDGTWD